MEGKSDFDKSLIDFNSPVSKPLNKPLIPVPVSENKLSTSPTNTNPFDVVARQTLDAALNDPFENVFKNAFDNFIEREGNTFNSQVNQTPCTENNESESKQNVNDHNTIKRNESNDVLPEKPEQYKKDETSQVTENNEVSIHINGIKNDITFLKSGSTFQNKLEGDSQTQVSSDFSTEDSLKAVIAKRVNQCIEKALNNSINIKYSKSENNLKSSGNAYLMEPMSRRSASFITQSTAHIKSDKMNKSCTDQSATSIPFGFENEVNTPESSIGSCDIKLLSGEISKIEDSVFEPNNTDRVFQEANKLAHTFSKLAGSFCNNADADMEEDLLSCKPRWLYTDSSEDEEEKLRNDPALNIRVSDPGPLAPSTPDSQALSAFKANRGLSLSNLHATLPEDEGIKRSNSFNDKPKTSKAVPVIIMAAPVAAGKPEENPIKLKKKSTTNTKRGGPMKAMMPIQIMTKRSFGKDDKINHSRECSPIRRQHSLQAEDTPVKDSSQVGMRPVASSTPNKSLTLSSQVPSNKRRSLGSTVESRKSRPEETDSGAKQRSNSANSGIPTAVAASRPRKPLVKEPLKPKSTSSLHRLSAASDQMNSCDRLSSKPVRSSTNPRVLSDVKFKSTKPGLVKTAVSTMSSMVRGKVKKMAARDKENRLPV